MTGEGESHLDFPCPQIKFSMLEMGYVQLSCLPNGSHGNLPTFQSMANTVGGSLKTDGKVLLLKPTPTQLSEHGDVELVPT